MAGKITSFFSKPGQVAPAVAKAKNETTDSGKQVDEKKVGQECCVDVISTPDKSPSQEEKIASSPPTKTRKRLRQTESDGSDDEGPNSKEPENKEKVAVGGGNEEEALAGGDGKELKKVESPAVSPAKGKQEVPKKEAAIAPMFRKVENKRPDTKKARDDSKQPSEREKEVQGSTSSSGWQMSKADGKGYGSGGEGEDEDEDHTQAAATMMLSSGDFDAAKEASWKKGEPVPYGHLAQAFEKIEATSKRLEITSILCRALRVVIETTPADLLACIYLCVNKLAPAHEGVELGLGDQVLKKALAEATGRQEKDIKSDYDKVGDLGIVAMKSRTTQRTMFQAKALTVQTVYKSLLAIAKMSGNQSGQQKKDKIKGLLVASKGVEAQYVVRHLQGKMRIGLAEQTVLVALAHAVALSSPVGEKTKVKKEALDRAVEILKEVFCQLPCYDIIIPKLLEKSIEELPIYCFLSPGIPIKPMLAHPTKGISEVLNRFEGSHFTCEFKYDGERGQIHRLEDGTVKIFSRNSEDNTSKYPDIISLVPKVIMDESVKTFVLDCEVVAFDRETKKILPFQVLSTRKRKDADETEIKVQVCLFAFDMLYLNGEPLIKKPLIERRKALYESFREMEGLFMFATARDATDTEEILAFLNESVAASCEGLMVKTLEAGGPGATYEPDKRSHKWLKVKKDYIAGMTDSLDLVPIGAFYGKGKRTGVYGAFLLACYNDETEDYETICKIGTGFSDEQLKDFHAQLAPFACDGPKSYYQWENVPKDTPDVWLEPKFVWEVAAADLSISPVHKAAAGLVHESKGIALRFPRLVRVRDDKTPEFATNSSQVAQMYQNQAVIGGEGGGVDMNDD